MGGEGGEKSMTAPSWLPPCTSSHTRNHTSPLPTSPTSKTTNKPTTTTNHNDSFFLDNVAGWILELDRGQGIPFEGNYSEWLSAKDKRLAQEERQQAHLKRTIESELEFISRQAKGQQKKGKDRLRRYDDLVAAASAYVKDSSVDAITIPVGPRLGGKVVEARGVSKAFGDRLLVEDLNFSVPPGAVVGVVGGNGAGKVSQRMRGTERAGEGDGCERWREGGRERDACATLLVFLFANAGVDPRSAPHPLLTSSSPHPNLPPSHPHSFSSIY